MEIQTGTRNVLWLNKIESSVWSIAPQRNTCMTSSSGGNSGALWDAQPLWVSSARRGDSRRLLVLWKSIERKLGITTANDNNIVWII